MISYFILASFIVMRLSIKKITTKVAVRSTVMLLVLTIGLVDLLVVHAFESRTETYLTGFINVFVLLFFIRSIREVWIQIFKVLLLSIPIKIIIETFLIISCYAAYILFGSDQSDKSFDNLSTSLYTVF